jgi:predicted transcriptional regulator
MTARDTGLHKSASPKGGLRVYVVAGSEFTGQTAGGLRSPVADGGWGCVASPRRADVAASERGEVKDRKKHIILPSLRNLRSSATVRNVIACNTKNSHDPAELGELERAVMRLVWQHRDLTAEQVREELDRPLKESTIRTVLRRLEEKGYVTHTLTNRTFIYKENRISLLLQRLFPWRSLSLPPWLSCVPVGV